MQLPGDRLGNPQNALNAQSYQTEVAETGLMRLASRVSEATVRIDGIALNLTNVSVGIHGPRPEPVSGVESGGMKNGADSLATRVLALMDSIDRLQRSYESIVR